MARKFKKEKLNIFSVKLGLFPVYVKDVYNGKEPFKVVGIRKNSIELEGDFSGGTHGVIQKDWYKIKKCFLIKSVCEEDLKPNGCQVPNIHCCGGGSIQTAHVDKYWDNLIKTK